jgi:hypothetical protein
MRACARSSLSSLNILITVGALQDYLGAGEIVACQQIDGHALRAQVASHRAVLADRGVRLPGAESENGIAPGVDALDVGAWLRGTRKETI